MPLQSMLPMLKRAQAEGYAVGLFDAPSLEAILAIVEAATELHAPVIIAPFLVDRRAAVALIRELADKAGVPVAIELDHGRDFAAVMDSIHAGFTDVMLDASTQPYDANVAATRQVVQAAHLVGLGVEAEIGHVGRGEDYASPGVTQSGYTQPEDAARFVAETGVDVLAVAFGSAHGVYKGEPKLDLARLAEIRARVEVPLVLHGGSGIPDDDFRRAIAAGINKVNIFTALGLAGMDAMRQHLASPTANYVLLLREVKSAIKDVVKHHMEVFGCPGRA
jgi:fructose-bisphosphate aldolase, class II